MVVGKHVFSLHDLEWWSSLGVQSHWTTLHYIKTYVSSLVCWLKQIELAITGPASGQETCIIRVPVSWFSYETALSSPGTAAWHRNKLWVPAVKRGKDICLLHLPSTGDQELKRPVTEWPTAYFPGDSPDLCFFHWLCGFGLVVWRRHFVEVSFLREDSGFITTFTRTAKSDFLCNL